MGSTTYMTPSPYVDIGACQKPVHADVRPKAQCHGSVALENQVTKHYQERDMDWEQDMSQRLH